VSERKVERAIAHGARTVDEVGEACHAGTCCGTCHETIEQMLATGVAVRPHAAFA
jgi:bacterioferritin-associated ferredoxin